MKIKNAIITFLLGLGGGIVTFFIFFSKIFEKGEKSLTDKAYQLDQNIKKQEKHLDKKKSQEAKKDIEKKLKKHKEDLDEEDISDLTDKFNATFNS